LKINQFTETLADFWYFFTDISRHFFLSFRFLGGIKQCTSTGKFQMAQKGNLSGLSHKISQGKMSFWAHSKFRDVFPASPDDRRVSFCVDLDDAKVSNYIDPENWRESLPADPNSAELI